MSLRRYWAVLKNHDFTKLWVSQLTSQLTNYLLSFAILIKVFRMTDSSAAVAIVILAFGVATVFFGSLAGVYSDRFDRRKILTIINFAQAASVALYFVIGSNFWALVLITFLYSSFNQFYIPAEAPSIPNLVPKSQLLVANSYFVFTGSASLIIGFAAAGPLGVWLGEGAPYALAVILLCIAGIATWLLPPLPSENKHQAHEFGNLWHEFKEGLNYFWGNKNLHFPLISLVLVQIINGMMITISPAFISEAIGIYLETGSLLVVAPLGAGILVGSVMLGVEEQHFSKKNLIFAGFLGMGTMMALMSFINHFDQKYLYYAVLAAVMGYFNSHIFAPSHSLLQIESSSHLRGRVYGSLYVVLLVAATFPTVFAGLLADRVPITYVMGLLGCTMILFGIMSRPNDKLTNFPG